jgi:starch synthase
MRIAILTNEYPPHVYGGAGVHVEYLSRELAGIEGGAHQVDVFCFGSQRVDKDNLRVRGIESPARFESHDPRHTRLLDAVARNLAMVGAVDVPDIVHCHTWYSHFAGTLARPLTAARLVLTTHSLEPHRPWKEEQLGSAYRATTWIERTAYENADGVIAVSKSMKDDVQTLYGVAPDRVRVIHNGIDPNEFRRVSAPATLRRLGVDPDAPIVLFVGRITRQKGILHLVRAIRHMMAGIQVVLCAGAPDTPEIAAEMKSLVGDVMGKAAAKVIWFPEMLPKEDVIALYSHADIFVCPSVYEPFGIINLEAMACETPVVAASVGGIPEIVMQGETGLLIPFRARDDGSAEPRDPDRYARALATAVNELMDAPERRRLMGMAARQRVVKQFSWTHIAELTLAFYRDLMSRDT